MAKKGQRRNAGAKVSTKSQAKKRSLLRRHNYSSKNVVRNPIPGWDYRKSLRANYANLGIAYDANSVVAKPREAADAPYEQALPSAAGILTDRLTYIQNLPKPEPYEVRSMSVQEQYRLQELIRTHGTDYEAMERDLTRNVMQETANKLQKRVELLFRIQSLRTGDIPIKVKSEHGVKTEENSDMNDDDEDDELPDEDEDDEFEEMDSSDYQEMIKAIQTPALIVPQGIYCPQNNPKAKALAAKAMHVPGAKEALMNPPVLPIPSSKKKAQSTATATAVDTAKKIKEQEVKKELTPLPASAGKAVKTALAAKKEKASGSTKKAAAASSSELTPSGKKTATATAPAPATTTTTTTAKKTSAAAAAKSAPVAPAKATKKTEATPTTAAKAPKATATTTTTTSTSTSTVKTTKAKAVTKAAPVPAPAPAPTTKTKTVTTKAKPTVASAPAPSTKTSKVAAKAKTASATTTTTTKVAKKRATLA